MRVRALVRRLVGDLVSDDAGSATTTVVASMRRATLRAMAGWQVVLVPTVVVEPLDLGTRAALLTCHLVLAGIALLAAERRAPSWLVVVAAYGVFLADWSAVTSVDQPLLLGSCWLANLAAALPTFVMRGRAALVMPIALACGVPVAMVLLWPDSGSPLPAAVAPTALAIILASRIGVSFLLDFTREADTQRELMDAERLSLEVRRAASLRAAEDARLVHDTVINTLGALANGGAGVDDLDLVRARCARDITTVASIVEDADLLARTGGIREGHDLLGIRVVERGLTGAGLRAQEGLLPPASVEVLARASTELVRNAAKHSGADEVVVDIRATGSGLVVEVSDEGVGFDGVARPGRGIAESVLARLPGTGVTLELVSAPGEGTQATLSWSGEGAPAEVVDDDLDDLQRVVVGLQRRASGLLAAGVVVVGLWLALTNHRGQFTAEYPMVAVVAAVCALAWWGRGWMRHRWVLPVVLTIGSSGAFVLSAQAVGFGRDDVVLWQAICPSGPLLLLAGDPAWRRFVPWAGGVVAATVVTLAALVAPDAGMAALSVLVAGVACVSLVGAWLGFQRMVATVGRQAVSDRQSALRLRTDAERRAAASRARRRWAVAGLSRSVGILREVAEEGTDPRTAPWPEICAEEESYLRQLTLLNPELVQMGECFARALAQARSTDRVLLVRSGSMDVDAPRAAAIGELMTAALSAVPAGAQVTATLFPAQHELRFNLVGPGPQLSQAADAWIPPYGTDVTVRHLGTQDLVEVVLTHHEVRREPRAA